MPSSELVPGPHLTAVQGNVRAAAREVGAKAIKQAAVIDQREKELTRQRKAHRMPLASRDELRAAAAAVANGWMLPQGLGKRPTQATVKTFWFVIVE